MADPKTEATKILPPTADKKPEIAVKVLRIHISTLDLPGSNGSSITSTPADAPAGRARHVITYLPHLRHHRVEYFKPNEKEPQVRMVHETHASWDPA